jgi:hypothetical protein
MTTQLRLPGKDAWILCLRYVHTCNTDSCRQGRYPSHVSVRLLPGMCDDTPSGFAWSTENGLGMTISGPSDFPTAWYPMFENLKWQYA